MNPPVAVLSETCMKDIILNRKYTKASYGNLECTAVLGCTHLEKARMLAILKPFWPHATIGTANFEVTSEELAKTNREIPQTLNPSADLHFHPSTGLPEPSYIDKKDLMKMAMLNSLIPGTKIQTSWIKRMIGALEGGKLTFQANPATHIEINGVREDSDKPFAARIVTCSSVSDYIGLVLPTDPVADAKMIRGHAVSHEFRAGWVKPRVIYHDDIKVLVLPDEKIATLTKLPLEEIQYTIDEAEIERQVAQRYTQRQYTYQSYGSGSYYSDVYGDWGGYGGNGYSHPATPYAPYDQLGSGNAWSNVTVLDPARGQRPDEMIYLSENSSPNLAAKLLAECAFLLLDPGLAKGKAPEFEFLHPMATRDEIAAALKEAVRVVETQYH